MSVTIRENIDQHMKELKDWLTEVNDCPPEEMAAFFERRLEGYEEHMVIWKPAYERFAQLLPDESKNILDLGCGTGLELDEIWKLRPDIHVTGVDLCREMIQRLWQKHSDKQLQLICQSYFDYDMSEEKWDAVISFESLHHFFPDEKLGLYRKIQKCLKPGGQFILGDYIACCDEEESILQEMYLEKRRRFHVPEGQFIHIDIPLTLEHETEVLKQAGFSQVTVVDSINGATLIAAVR